MPAPAVDDAGVYVAAAYLVFVALVVVYVVILASKLKRTKRGLEDLAGHIPKDGDG